MVSNMFKSTFSLTHPDNMPFIGETSKLLQIRARDFESHCHCSFTKQGCFQNFLQPCSALPRHAS